MEGKRIAQGRQETLALPGSMQRFSWWRGRVTGARRTDRGWREAPGGWLPSKCRSKGGGAESTGGHVDGQQHQQGFI